MKPRHARYRESKRAARAATGQRQPRTPEQILAEDYGMTARQIDEVTHEPVTKREEDPR